jgi:hypothetical protein
MPFDQNNLPEWNAPGVEPPQSKKDSGWGVQEKPPGDWFNWFFNKTYNALKSLFTNAQHKEEKGQPNGYASLDGSGKVPTTQLPTATPTTPGAMSASDKSKLDGIAPGAEVNQNAFANIKVGATTIAADNKTDTLELVAGNALTLTPDAINDKVTIAVPNATTSAPGAMSAADKSKLDGIATGAEVNQNAFSNVKVGSTTISADSKTDTLELVAGTNIILTPDEVNDKVTIGLSSNVETTAGAQAKANQAEANAINFSKGFGLGSTVKDIGGGDLNTINGSGFYQCSTAATNTPVAGFGFIVIHTEVSSQTAYQTAYMISVNNRMFIRRKSSGTWEPWREIAVQGQAFYDAAHVNFADSNADGVYYRVVEHGGSGDFEIRAYNAADNTSLKTLFRVSKDGVVSLLYQSHVDVSRSTALAVASATDVKISFQTESKDSVNEFASDKFTPLATGVYLFTGYFNFATTPAGHIYLKIYKNGSPWQTFPCGHTDRLATFARSIYIPQPGSDYFEFYVHQSSGASVNLDNMAMQITKLA